MSFESIEDMSTEDVSICEVEEEIMNVTLSNGNVNMTLSGDHVKVTPACNELNLSLACNVAPKCDSATDKIGLPFPCDDGQNMSDRSWGLSGLPLQDVVFPMILPLLGPKDWCTLRAVDKAHQEIIAQFLAANRTLKLPYCKQLTEPALRLLTEHASSLRTLVLPGCKLLTDDLLRPLILASPRLTVLDLSDCHHLTSGILQTVTIRCPYLSRLLLRDCHWVSRISLKYHCEHQGRQAKPLQLPPVNRVGSTVSLPQPQPALYRLQEVDLTGCWELDDATVTSLIASFPRISIIRLGNIYSLTDITMKGLATHTRYLNVLDIRGCWRVTDQGMSLVAEYCTRLKEVSVHDCRDITELSLSKLRQNEVKVDRKLDPIMLRLMRMRNQNKHARLQI